MKAIKNQIKLAIKHMLPGHLPDFIVVGAQKSATTSLHYYLSQHPNIIGSRPKEVRYFDRDENYEKGLNWYKHNFPNTKIPFKSYKYFESTPEYLYRSYVAKRIHEFSPNIKIVILLRDPVERAYSSWTMYRDFKKRKQLPAVMFNGHARGTANNIFQEFYASPEFPTFEHVIEEDIKKFEIDSPFEEPSIVRRGLYYYQIKRFYEYFDRNDILVLGFKDIIGSNKTESLNAILNLIGLQPSNWDFLKHEPKNKSKYREKIGDGAAEKLKTFYKLHNELLFDLIGFKPNW